MIDHAFGARLRHERERRGIDLSSIAHRTKIAPALLVSLERGDVSRWPGGIYRRSFVRAYAEAVGLDPDDVAREFAEAFEREEEPQPSVAAPRVPPATVHPPVARPALGHVRVRIDPPPRVWRRGPVLSDRGQRLGAVAADLTVLVVVAAGLAMAFGEFWMMVALVMVCYYAGGILVFGNTPGVCLFAMLGGDGEHADSHPAPPAPAGVSSRTSPHML